MAEVVAVADKDEMTGLRRGRHSLLVYANAMMWTLQVATLWTLDDATVNGFGGN